MEALEKMPGDSLQQEEGNSTPGPEELSPPIDSDAAAESTATSSQDAKDNNNTAKADETMATTRKKTVTILHPEEEEGNEETGLETFDAADNDPGAAANNLSASSSPSTDQSPPPPLTILSLPLDSLHHVASFLTVPDWTHNGFGGTCALARRESSIVLGRVITHALKCAMEVAAAWHLGRYADARALTTLYQRAGVPIYPLPGLIQLESWEKNNKNSNSSNANDNSNNNNNNQSGTNDNNNNNNNPNNSPLMHGPGIHAFRTMLWRMRAELKYKEQQRDEQDETSNSPENQTDDWEEWYFEQRVYFRLQLQHRVRHLIQTNRLAHPNILQEEPSFTYAEEKALYWKQVQDGQSSSAAQPFWLNPPGAAPPPHPQDPLQNLLDPLRPPDPLEDLIGLNNNNPLIPPSANNSSNPASPPLKNLSIHEHLLDQHRLGWSALSDEEEEALTNPVRNNNNNVNNNNDVFANMAQLRRQMQQEPSSSSTTNPSPFSLSADFFHPPAARHDEDDNDSTHEPRLVESQSTKLDATAVVAEPLLSLDDDDFDDEERALVERMNQQELQEQQNNQSGNQQRLDQSLQEEANAQVRLAISDYRSVAKATEWETYSAATAIRRNESTMSGSSDSATRNLAALFTKYEQRLKTCLEETLLSANTRNTSSEAIEDVFFDFWDECCFPQTAHIHYFDKNTAVPRVSKLEQFLMQPCPKSAGIVQCEIERVKKMSYNSNGTGVKGRFFPTYEYRLFIRHVNPNKPDGVDDDDEPNNSDGNQGGTGSSPLFVRNDTLLLVAKHRGRSSSKKGSGGGSNNYALFLPERDDLQAHFSMVNQERSSGSSSSSSKKSTVKHRGSPRQQPARQSSFMGRLQGNFIGTEFQLFVPTSHDGQNLEVLSEDPEDVSELNNRKKFRASASLPIPVQSDDDDEEDDEDVDGGYGSEGNIPSRQQRQRRRRRSQSAPRRSSSLSLSRLLLRGSSRGASRESDDEMVSESVSQPFSSSSKRPNRRAIANENQISPRHQSLPNIAYNGGSPSHREEENVIITYTANLLGSRPRIMDVCIPKVNASGTVGSEWKHYLDRLRRQAFEEQQEQLMQQPQSPAQSNRRGGSGSNDASSSGPASNPAVAVDDSRRMLQCFRQLQQRLENNPNLEMQQETTNASAPSDNASGDAETEIDLANIEENNYGLMALQNRPPWWNVELGSFVLNFGGRVSVASVKNFQLVNRSHNNPNHPNNPNNNQNNANNDDSNIILQFGRIQGRHSFTMDFQHPLSAVQAFSIAISSLQSKISFG